MIYIFTTVSVFPRQLLPINILLPSNSICSPTTSLRNTTQNKMFSFRTLTPFMALSTTAYSAGTLQVVNKCSYDVTIHWVKGGLHSEDPEQHTLTAGGGGSPAYEHPHKGQVVGEPILNA